MKYTQYSNWTKYAHFFMESFTMNDDYAVCGIGEGFRTLLELFPEVKVDYCLDAQTDVEFVTDRKIRVLSYDILMCLEREQKFIITAGSEYYSEIKNTLTRYGVEEKNICGLQEILFFWGWYYGEKIISSACNVFLLTNCNLNCKGCSQFTPYIVNHHYNSVDSIKESLNHYFTVFDYVKDLVLVGGETMLYQGLGKICSYIEEHFTGHYHELKIFTNGLIVPDKDVMEEIGRAERVHVYISDYTCSIEKGANLLVESLQKYNIKFTLNKGFGQSEEYQWFDLGNPTVCKTKDIEVTRDKFRRCSLVCQNLIDNKVYYCVPACAARMGEINVLNDSDMWLDLVELGKMPPSGRAEAIGKFNLGFVEKGYLEFCFYCNGFGKDINAHYIKAGEQYRG